MSKNQHRSNEPLAAANQNNQMSDDPADGNRTSFITGKDGITAVEKAPPDDAQDQRAIAAFGADGGSKGKDDV